MKRKSKPTPLTDAERLRAWAEVAAAERPDRRAHAAAWRRLRMAQKWEIVFHSRVGDVREFAEKVLRGGA